MAGRRAFLTALPTTLTALCTARVPPPSVRPRTVTIHVNGAALADAMIQQMERQMVDGTGDLVPVGLTSTNVKEVISG